jgi:hypothetical protein
MSTSTHLASKTHNRLHLVRAACGCEQWMSRTRTGRLVHSCPEHRDSEGRPHGPNGHDAASMAAAVPS